MPQKTLTLKARLGIGSSTLKPPKARKKDYRLVKKRTLVINKVKTGVTQGTFYLFLGILAGLSLFLLVILGYQTYKGFKLYTRVVALRQEYFSLKKEYKALTSNKVLVEKAKELGLHPPKKEDIIILR